MKKLTMLVLGSLFLSSCTPLLKWQTEFPDNMAEEYIEDVIKDKTGRNIDLTPVTGKEKQTLNTTGK